MAGSVCPHRWHHVLSADPPLQTSSPDDSINEEAAVQLLSIEDGSRSKKTISLTDSFGIQICILLHASL